MPDNAHHDFYRRLMEAATGEVDPRRVDGDRRALMALIAEIFGVGRSVVLLWLVDSGGFPEIEELRLAYVWYGDGSERERPEKLCGRMLPKDQDPATVRPKWLTEWYGEAFPSFLAPSHCSHRLKYDGDHIGCVHVLSHGPLGEQETAQSDPRLRTVLAALATKVVVGRRVRANGAMQKLQRRLSNVKKESEVWEAIARTAREYTAAKIALVYRPVGVDVGRELSVYAGSLVEEGARPRSLLEVERHKLASTADSVTLRAFGEKGVIRIRDIKDNREVSTRFAMNPYPHLLAQLDGILAPARSWMVVSVRVDTVIGKPGGIMLIKVMNKRGGAYLHDSFTRADAAIMERIGEFLVTYLPGKALSEAVSTIVKPFQNQPVDGAGSELVGERLLDGLVRGLSRHVQGLEAIAFQYPRQPPACSKNGKALAHYDVGSVAPQEVIREWGDGRWLYVKKVGGEGRMLVLLRDSDLPNFQAEIIRRVGAEVVWIYREIASYRDAIQRMVEIRHAIRSGVQGVLGNVKPALAKLGLIMKDPRPEILDREFVRGAQFRKALEKAFIAASHVGKVLEEGRYAFVGVERENLRINSCKLSVIISDVLSISRIEAEFRGLRIGFLNLVPDDVSVVTCDRAAVAIVFQNIIENAIKYGFRDTDITVKSWVDKGGWFVSVEDEGVYIDPDDYKVIFQPFKRVSTHDPAAPRGGISSRPGTGLGLAICRRIVEAHDPQARIKVVSRRLSPEGPARTTFTVSMPRRLTRSVVAEEKS